MDQPEIFRVTSQQMTSYHIESRKLIRNWYLQDGTEATPAILPTMPQLDHQENCWSFRHGTGVKL